MIRGKSYGESTTTISENSNRNRVPAATAAPDLRCCSQKPHLAKKRSSHVPLRKLHIELTKVRKMFTELMVALDFDIGGDIAHQLMRIYDFIYHRLVQANIRQDISIIDECRQLLNLCGKAGCRRWKFTKKIMPEMQKKLQPNG